MNQARLSPHDRVPAYPFAMLHQTSASSADQIVTPDASDHVMLSSTCELKVNIRPLRGNGRGSYFLSSPCMA